MIDVKDDNFHNMNLFETIFANDPSATAIVSGSQSITYRELRTRIIRMAQALSSLGVQTGDRVALLLHDCSEFVEAFIAICSSGAIAVPINPAVKLDAQCSILNNSGAQFLLTENELCNALLTDASEKLQQLRHVVVIDSNEARSPHQTLQELMDATASAELPEFPIPTKDEPAFILYTSGSTGEPKGAIHSQADIFYTNNSFCREVLKLTNRDRLFSSSRLPFAYGLGNSLSFPLLNGATSILCAEKPTPDVISRVFVESQPTIFFGVPVVYNLLLDQHRKGRILNTSSLRLCISAGEALPAHLGESWEKEFGVQVLDGIGSTEMLHMFMSNHDKDVRYGSSGKLLAGYEARLLDEQGSLVEGTEGTLWIKGDSAAKGYWHQPEQTSRTFVDGWVRTGDLYRRENSYWYYMGRSDDCFKSSGQWVSPVEVEGVLIRHNYVQSSAVVEDFDGNGLSCPCAFVVCHGVKSEAELDNELRELADASLPRFKRPKRYLFVKELPYTATGKIQRFKLRQALRSNDTTSL